MAAFSSLVRMNTSIKFSQSHPLVRFIVTVGIYTSSKRNAIHSNMLPRENVLFSGAVLCLHPQTCSGEKKVTLVVGQPGCYVINQNMNKPRVTGFPNSVRHACTVHLPTARRTQCPQLATHLASVTFFSCWLSRPIR